MAPEQVEGKEATACSDIFSFGSVLYEMATGKRALKAKSQISVASSILGKIRLRRHHYSDCAALLDHAVSAPLCADPDARWHSAADVARELRWIGTSSGSAFKPRPGSAAGLTWPLARTRSWAALAAALLGVVLWLALRPTLSTPLFTLRSLPPPDTIFDFTGDFWPAGSLRRRRASRILRPRCERTKCDLDPAAQFKCTLKAHGTEGGTFLRSNA